MTSGAPVLAALDAIGTVIWCSTLEVLPAEGGADDCRRQCVAGAGEIAAPDRSDDGGWRQGCDGHELSSPIDGIDDDHTPAAARTSVPLVVVVTIFGAAAVPARRRRVGYAEEPAGQCDIACPVAVGEEAIVADAMEPVGQDVDQEAADELVGVERHQLVASIGL